MSRTAAAPFALPAAVVMLVVATLAGCSASPAAQPSTSAAVATAGATPGSVGPSSAAPASTKPGSGAVTQTDTEWGRIWDALPASFPRYPGASPVEATVPASAVLVVPTDVQTATAWMKAALGDGEWATVVAGPLEDGTMVLDSIGAGDCQLTTRIARVGSTTQMTILYGAGCPFQ